MCTARRSCELIGGAMVCRMFWKVGMARERRLPIVSVETPRPLRRPEGLLRSWSVNVLASTLMPRCSAWCWAWCWRFLTWAWAVFTAEEAMLVNQPPHPPVDCCAAGAGVVSSAGESSAVVVAGVYAWTPLPLLLALSALFLSFVVSLSSVVVGVAARLGEALSLGFVDDRREGVPGRDEGRCARLPSSARRSCSVCDLLLCPCPWLDFGARAVVGLEGRVLGWYWVDRSSNCAKRSSGLFDALGGIVLDVTAALSH